MEQTHFFEIIRNSAITFSIMVLIPLLSYYTARLIIGKPAEQFSYNPRNAREMEQIQERINILDRSERSLLSRPGTEATEKKLSELRAELEKLSNQKNELQAKENAEHKELRKKYEAEKAHQGLILFYVASIIGLISIIFGLCINIGFIGAGAIFGGVFSLILGYTAHWGQLHILLKLISVIIALIAIIGISYQFAKKNS